MAPGESKDDPRDRPTSRVILLDRAGRTLLFTVEEPDDETGKRVWFPPGGGLEPGETYEDAARRELFEETGLEVPIGPCIWVSEPFVRFLAPENAWCRFVQRFFIAYAEGPEVKRNGWTEVEVRLLSEHRWWTMDEIAASTDVFSPRCIASVLPPIIAGHLPAAPIQIVR